MILNAAQIAETKNALNNILIEQKRIHAEASNVVNVRLAAAWDSQAQKAYSEVYAAVSNGLLTQIENLIALFSTAFEQSSNGLYQVDIDLSKMNSAAITE